MTGFCIRHAAEQPWETGKAETVAEPADPQRTAEDRIEDALRDNSTSLDLSRLGLEALPGSLTRLNGLTALYLGGNKLSALPEWFGLLANLTQLDLSSNRMTSLPEWFGELTTLTELDLSGNGLSDLPPSFGQLTDLTELDLGGNRLGRIPESFGPLTRLTTLNLSSNRLSELPESFGLLTHLTWLYLRNNLLVTIPESFGGLTRLTQLDLATNRLAALPESIGHLTSLIRLDLSANDLPAIPASFGQLSSLNQLDLSDNELKALPDSFVQLTSLARLYLAGNGLSALPESIGRLTSLTDLDLSDTDLATLPESLGQLTKLRQLYLHGNKKLTSPPPEVVDRGTPAVLSYLQALAAGSVRLWQSKVMIVGEATVGKTSLAKQMRGDDFDPYEGQTHGVRVHQVSIRHPLEPQIGMRLDLWDFGGQLEYRATQRLYLTDRSLFLLVWNARARSVDGKVVPWLDTVTARAPGSPIIVVATHGDEHSPATLPSDLPGRYRQIAAVHTVDSGTGSGIGRLLEEVAHQAVGLPLMGIWWPATWVAAASAVRALPGRTATERAVFTVMAGAGVTDPVEQRTIAAVMHDLGQIVYFADRPDLSSKVILQPQWLDARITQTIDSKAVTDSGGVLSRAERHRLWDDLAQAEDDPDLPDRLVRMMEEFDLAYRTGDEHNSPDVALVVDRLPEARPDQVDKVWREHAAEPGAREIGIIYKLASRQAGIPTWFIAREHRYTTGLHWRTGALLHDRDPQTPAWALISDDGREQPTVSIRVTGSYPVRFLSVLTEAFNNIINDRYPGLVEKRLIPCACQDGVGGRCEHAFTLNALLAEATDTDLDADHKVRCEVSGRKIEAAVMLDGLRGTGLVAEFESVHRHLDALDSSLSRVEVRQQAMLNGIRTLLEDRANADVRCPAVFSIQATGTSRVLKRDKYVLRLWCEWPSGPHLLDDGAGDYPIDTIPEALSRYLPYLRYLIAALNSVAPGVLAAGAGERAQGTLEAAAATLGFIDTHLGGREGSAGLRSGIPAGPYRRTAVGADFRALRDLLHRLENEHHKNWGGLAPVSRPEDRHIIYLCRDHRAELDFPYTGGPKTAG